MTIINVASLEKRKAAYLETHENRLVSLYTQEMHKVMTWFVKKYPKRRLEWVSGMGTFDWYLDGKPLDCADLETDFNHWMQLSNRYGTKPRKPCRIMQRLMTLWDFYNFVILDDDSDMLLWHQDNYFRTDPWVGLTPSVAYRAARFLNRY